MNALRPAGALALAVALFALVACSPSRPVEADPIDNAPATARKLASHYGEAKACTIDLRIIAQPEGGSSLSFNLVGWLNFDGRVRISCTKAGVEFMEALIQSDGSFRALLTREKRVVRGSLQQLAAAIKKHDARGGEIFARLRTFTRDLRFGPIAEGNRWRVEEEWVEDAKGASHKVPRLVADIDGGLTAAHEIADNQVKTRIISDRSGEIYRLNYRNERLFDGLPRPSKTNLILPDDGSRYLIRLRALDRVPSISRTSLALNTPSGWQQMSIDDFLALLVAE
jgi:hypothetical protein